MRNARGIVISAVIAGVISGACNTGMIALITLTLNGQGDPMTRLWVFIALCAVAPLARVASEMLLVQLGQRSIFELRMQLSRRILSVPLKQLEGVGPHRLTAALTDDVFAVTGALTFIPILCINIAVVIGCLIYLGMLSFDVFLVVFGFIILGIISYQLPIVAATRSLVQAREVEDSLYGNFRAMIEGIKELKMHGARRHAFLNDVLGDTAATFQRHNVKGMLIYTIASSWGQLLVFVVIGLVLFALPAVQTVTSLALTGYALTILYMMTPLQVILNTLPNMSRASVALNKIEQLNLSLAAFPAQDELAKQPAPAVAYPGLELVGVTHTYYLDVEERNFTLGPIDLRFGQGEVVFLVGGNGSGKTTLAKLLVGLYAPEAGEIRCADRAVTDETRAAYREYFSVVFSDFYLFESLLGIDRREIDTKARNYLKQLQLDHKVQVKGDALTTTQLSQGQRKRLALLTAYLEDRPVYLFDEWAADQDPLFKKVFYHQLLPELKARGKTVFVISHDDHYYFVADRIIKLDYGKVEYDRRTGDALAAAAEVPVGAAQAADAARVLQHDEV